MSGSKRQATLINARQEIDSREVYQQMNFSQDSVVLLDDGAKVQWKIIELIII